MLFCAPKTIVFSGISISYSDKTVVASNFIDNDDTAFTELTRDNRLFCLREEKNKRKECYCRHTAGVVDFNMINVQDSTA